MKKLKKLEHLTNLLNKLNQPFMVFDSKIFIIPTTSPMFELLPQTSFSNGDFKVLTMGGAHNRKALLGTALNYTMLLIDLDTYEIDPVCDTFEYINEQKELI